MSYYVTRKFNFSRQYATILKTCGTIGKQCQEAGYYVQNAIMLALTKWVYEHQFHAHLPNEVLLVLGPRAVRRRRRWTLKSGTDRRRPGWDQRWSSVSGLRRRWSVSRRRSSTSRRRGRYDSPAATCTHTTQLSQQTNSTTPLQRNVD